MFTNDTEFFHHPDKPRAFFLDDVWVTEGDIGLEESTSSHHNSQTSISNVPNESRKDRGYGSSLNDHSLHINRLELERITVETSVDSPQMNRYLPVKSAEFIERQRVGLVDE